MSVTPAQLELELGDHKVRARERIRTFNFVREVARSLGFTPRQARSIASVAVRRRRSEEP